jgi:hypothetical protein
MSRFLTFLFEQLGHICVALPTFIIGPKTKVFLRRIKYTDEKKCSNDTTYFVSGRRRDCSRRPPTPPGIRFRTTAVHVALCRRCN